MQTIHMIWAENNNHIIGDKNTIPWHLPEDLKHFRDLTTGKTVIMGTKTWHSLPRKPLPGRRNIIISRHTKNHDGAETYPTIETALKTAGDDTWIIGGTQIYNLAMPYATHLHITHIDNNADGDTHAPTINHTDWATTETTPWQSNLTGTRYRHHTLQRVTEPIYLHER